MSDNIIDGLTTKSPDQIAKFQGGPAFPSETSNVYYLGMTMRDWFAGQALIALGNNTMWVKGMDERAVKDGGSFKEYLARHSYDMADEMLKAGSHE